jgi:sirohydrochlorin cobaltochelatase
MGKHAREDLPLLMTQLRQAHPDIAFKLLPTAGEQPRLTALLAELALEAE